VVGSIERISDGNGGWKMGQVFAVVVENHEATTLEDIIHTYIKLGSIVITDCWKAYSKVGKMEADGKLAYIHMTINHTETFVDPVTGVYTNTIKAW